MQFAATVRRPFTAALCSVLIAVAGCSSHTSGPTPHSGTAATTPGASVAPAAPQSFQLEKENWLSFGHFLISKNLRNGDDRFGHFDATGLFHPKLGRISVDASHLVSNAEVTGQVFNSSGTADAPTIVGAVQAIKPAHDLEPRTVVDYLFQREPSGSLKLGPEVFRLPATSDGQYRMAVGRVVGSSNGVVAYTLADPSQLEPQQQTIGFELATGRQVWSRPGFIAEAVHEGGVAVVTGGPNSDKCFHYSVLDVTTGQEVFAAEGHPPVPGIACDQLKALSWQDAGVLAVVVPHKDAPDEVKAYDFRHKRMVALSNLTTAIDTRSDLAIASGEFPSALEVRDVVSGQTVHTFDKAQVEGVRLSSQALLAKKLWATTTDEKLILDATTGATLTRGYSSVPEGDVDGCVLYSDGKFVKE